MLTEKNDEENVWLKQVRFAEDIDDLYTKHLMMKAAIEQATIRKITAKDLGIKMIS